jgi:D-3-phosphoglycerate dehydrogenase
MPKPARIVVPGDYPIQIAGSPQLARLQRYGEVVLHADLPPDREEKRRRVIDADVILNSRSTVTWRADDLAQLPSLKLIATCSIGTDAIDLVEARRRGVTVCNQPGRTAPLVAEHCIALLMACAKRVAFQTAELKAGRWTQRENVLLRGKTLGVVGTGHIGGEVARLARALGMEVIAWTFHPTKERAEQLGVRFVQLDNLLAEADAVCICVKLTEESRGLLGQKELGRMKPGSLLVNAARGAIVDTKALVDALDRGPLGGAGLDVYDTEPLPPGHPLLGCEQVVLTPHNADQTPEGVELLNEGAVDNIVAFLEGRPQHVANP